MNPISDFIEQERSKMSWFDKLGGYQPHIVRTAEILASSFPDGLPDVTKIRKSVLVMISAMISFLFALFMILFFFGMLFKPHTITLLILAMIAVMAYVGIHTGWNLLFNKRYAFKLAIGYTGIRINDTEFLWQDITDTAIMYRWERRQQNLYLIIFLKDGTIEKRNLFNYRIKDYKLAGIIEYYKQKAVR